LTARRSQRISIEVELTSNVVVVDSFGVRVAETLEGDLQILTRLEETFQRLDHVRGDI